MKVRFDHSELVLGPRAILTACIFAASFFGWIFLKIVNEIWIEKESFPFEQAISTWIRNIQTPFGQKIFYSVTLLGNMEWLVAIILCAAAFLVYKRLLREALVLSGGFAVTGASVLLIKFISDRPRPVSDFTPAETFMAFPSGHMAHSLFVYGFIAYLLSRQAKNNYQAIWIMLTGISLAGIIGLSRLYLNVHWLSDVLGGFALAAAYLSLCIGYLETHRTHAPGALR